jgi:RNA polymerase sigma-70 factor, ECF subfamily
MATLDEPAPALSHDASSVHSARLRRVIDGNLDFVWRIVRRLGVPEPDADDAAQQCFVVLSRRLGTIASGDERSFLFATAIRVASEWRRRRPSRKEVDVAAVCELADPAALPDASLDLERARQLLDEIVRTMPIRFGAAFVLYELEGLTAKEISKALKIPMGTVASRIRKGRALFDAALHRWQARLANIGARQ